MKASYITNLMSSFYLWLDHEILTRGEAFINYSGKLYNSPDPNFPNNSIYGSPFRQWVYDSSVPNANISSGIFVNGNFIDRGVSGLKIDFNKGRAILNSGLNSNNVTATYSFKEYNIYYTDEREEKLLFEKAYNVTPKVTQVTGALGYLDTPYPCIFIKHRMGENVPFAFGGEDSTETMVRCIVLASNSFSLDGLISILSDSARKVFPVLNPDDFPFNYFGDFKLSNNFNYINLCKNQPSNSLVYIDKVTVSKLDEIDNAKINKKCVAALVDFELSDLRYPRVYDQEPAQIVPGLLSSVDVQNGGWPNLNGTFVYTTEFQGKPYYNKDGNGNWFIAWFENQWNIFDFAENGLDAIYWSPEDVLYPWMVNNWYTINSQYLPVPKVNQII
jgi:hypothetical protein